MDPNERSWYNTQKQHVSRDNIDDFTNGPLITSKYELKEKEIDQGIGDDDDDKDEEEDGEFETADYEFGLLDSDLEY